MGVEPLRTEAASDLRSRSATCDWGPFGGCADLATPSLPIHSNPHLLKDLPKQIPLSVPCPVSGFKVTSLSKAYLGVLSRTLW